MGSPISEEDPGVDEGRHTGYDVQLYITAVEKEEYRLSRVHLKTEADKVTMSGTAVLKLQEDDVVQIRVKPRGLRAKKYRVPIHGAALTVQLLRWF